jgi:hypothetical protein
MAELVSRLDFLPIPLSTMKEFLRVTHSKEDAFLTDLIRDARNFVEVVSGEAVTEATFLQYFSASESSFLADIRNAKELLMVEFFNGTSWEDVTGLYRLKVDHVPATFEVDVDCDPTETSTYQIESGINDLFAFLLGGLSNDEVVAIRSGKRNFRIRYKAGKAQNEEIDGLFRRVMFLYCGFFYEHRQAMEAPKYLFDFLSIDRKYHVV